jgi:hypothetical protein
MALFKLHCLIGFGSLLITNPLAFEDPFTIVDSTLSFTEPISSRLDISAVDSNGNLIRFLPQSSLITFFLDVGLDSGKVASVWLRQVPHIICML